MLFLLFLFILVIFVVILYRRGAFTLLLDFMRGACKEFSGGCDFDGACDCGKVNEKITGGCEFCAALGGNEVIYSDETFSESKEYSNAKFTNCMFEAGQKFNKCEFIGRNMINGDSTLTDCNGSGEVIMTGNVSVSSGKYETVEHSGEIDMKSINCNHVKICGEMIAENCSFGSIDIWGEADGCSKDGKVKLNNCKYEKINTPVDKDLADILEEINNLDEADKITDVITDKITDKITDNIMDVNDEIDETEETIKDNIE